MDDEEPPIMHDEFRNETMKQIRDTMKEEEASSHEKRLWYSTIMDIYSLPETIDPTYPGP